MKYPLGGIPVARAMLTDFRTLEPGDSLARAAELILAGSQHDFPVVEDGRVTGVLTRGDLIGALSARQNTLQPVAGVMQREFQVADSSDMLESGDGAAAGLRVPHAARRARWPARRPRHDGQHRGSFCPDSRGVTLTGWGIAASSSRTSRLAASDWTSTVRTWRSKPSNSNAMRYSPDRGSFSA